MGVRTTTAVATAFLVLTGFRGLAQPQYPPLQSDQSRLHNGANSEHHRSPTDDRKNAIRPPRPIGSETDITGSVDPRSVQSIPAEIRPENSPTKDLPPQFRRRLVDYRTTEPAGTIVIDTANTYLYLVLGNNKAMRYGIGVGREGFTWAGSERISRMAEWPDWNPPPEMIEREPHLPRFMAGGQGNPLGARALYLGKSLYRIHGTNQPSTIGTFVSSGCIRLTNDDIIDLYARVQVGARVVVLRGQPSPSVSGINPNVETRLVPPAVETRLIPPAVETRLVPPAEVPITPVRPEAYR